MPREVKSDDLRVGMFVTVLKGRDIERPVPAINEEGRLSTQMIVTGQMYAALEGHCLLVRAMDLPHVAAENLTYPEVGMVALNMQDVSLGALDRNYAMSMAKLGFWRRLRFLLTGKL